jgi:hypothetical protein|tara:strand:- start:4117 stop:5439 length:1323 start_codon:yes stop_codon:yes gene_type:complete
MASVYTNDLRLDELGTGDASGTWGTVTNTNLQLIGEGLSFTTKDCFSSDADASETVLDGGSDPARGMYFKVTSSATLSATRVLTILPNTISRLQFIENATTGSQIITIKQGSGSTVNIPNGQVKAVYLDGAGAGAAVVDAFTNLNLGGTTVVDDLTISDDLTVTDDLIVNGDIDLEGSIDVNGTTETDALSINGTSVTSTATELNLLDGSTANTVVNSKAVIYGASGELAGTLSTAAQTNVTSLGTLTTLTVDDITINGSTISDAGDLTIDCGGDIILDADGSDISLRDDGTEFGRLSLASSGLQIFVPSSDADLFIKGNDGGSTITALTLDMSAGGAATFNNDVTAFSDERLKTDISNIENGLEKVMQMQGVHYKRRDVENAKPQIGVLAQDMEAIIPEVVLTADDEMQTKSVDYGKLTAVLIEAIKDLKAEIDELKKG